MRAINLTLFLVLTGCGANHLSLPKDSSHGSFWAEGGILFTALDHEVVQQKSMTMFSAGMMLWADRVFAPSVGFADTQLSDDKIILQDRDLNNLSGTISCNSSFCELDISIYGENCGLITLPFGTEFNVPCGNVGNVHLFDKSVLSSNPDRQPQAPIDDFEFLPLGNPHNRNHQVLPFVSSARPIVFALRQHLAEKPDFLEDLQMAMNYWNAMIGFEALSYNLDLPADTGFNPILSVINSESDEQGGGLARATSYADPKTGEIISGKMDILGSFFQNTRESQRTTLAHELGHVLGLAHNFASSEDFQNHGTEAATSVMDYSDPVSLQTSLPYDKAAIDWIYRGSRSPMTYRSCNDREVTYTIGCDKSDTAQS